MKPTNQSLAQVCRQQPHLYAELASLLISYGELASNRVFTFHDLALLDEMLQHFQRDRASWPWLYENFRRADEALERLKQGAAS